ncbi:hypothetical protein [Paenibacillus sp. RUD330]|nr:hypothetical protein [Paenibacillus sp. RUD330]
MNGVKIALIGDFNEEVVAHGATASAAAICRSHRSRRGAGVGFDGLFAGR